MKTSQTCGIGTSHDGNDAECIKVVVSLSSSLLLLSLSYFIIFRVLFVMLYVFRRGAQLCARPIFFIIMWLMVILIGTLPVLWVLPVRLPVFCMACMRSILNYKKVQSNQFWCECSPRQE